MVIFDYERRTSSNSNINVMGRLKNRITFLAFSWGPHSVDRFANSNNHKLARFYSRCWNPGSEGVDAFCYHQCPSFPGSLGILLIVELWRLSSYLNGFRLLFWPMLFAPHSPYFHCVQDTILFTEVPGIFVRGSVESVFDGPKFK